MRNLRENGFANHALGFLSRVSGVGAFSESARYGIQSGYYLGMDARLFGLSYFGWKLAMPSMTELALRNLRGLEDRVGSHSKATAVTLDLIGLIGPVAVALAGDPVRGLELKVAYNSMAEIIPDALRSIKRRFTPGPSLLAV